MSRVDRWKYNVARVKANPFTGTLRAEALQEELERHGNQGWELVQIVRSQGGWGCAQLIFKKPA
jgi:hypothetical protein